MGAYVEILEHAELQCRFREAPRQMPVLTILSRA